MRAVMLFFLLRGLSAIALRKTSESVQPGVALKNDPKETPTINVYRHFKDGTNPIKLNPLGVVAGHAFGGGDDSTMFQGGGQVYKPVDDGDARAQTEITFYDTLFNKENKQDCLTEFLPAYGGVHQLYTSPDETDDKHLYLSGKNYIVLEDITENLEHPNIIDLKMGTRIYALNAKEEKKIKQQKSYPEQTEFGFRITGAKVWNSTTNAYNVQKKGWGPSLHKKDEVTNGLKWFFGNNQQSLKPLVDELQDLRDCMSKKSEWEFIGSSLLMAYNGVNPGTIKMRAIDFAYAAKRKDETDSDDIIDPVKGYVKGLNVLIDFLQEILKKRI